MVYKPFTCGLFYVHMLT